MRGRGVVYKRRLTLDMKFVPINEHICPNIEKS